ncbi:MAG: hypothetical protein CM15mP74_12240 [Halieaceae bacterium]|nr:MAG: hypothetical protein CM15mP74_12240 [Halieaceae bacterium]
MTRPEREIPALLGRLDLAEEEACLTLTRIRRLA